MTLTEYKCQQYSLFIHELEHQLRRKYKYSEDRATTWDEVKEAYYKLREEYLMVDLAELDTDTEEQL